MRITNKDQNKKEVSFKASETNISPMVEKKVQIMKPGMTSRVVTKVVKQQTSAKSSNALVVIPKAWLQF